MDEASDIHKNEHGTLTEGTMISMSLVLLLLGSIAGGVFYVATALGREETTRARLDRLEAKQEIYNQTVEAVDKKLSNIEGYLRAQEERRRAR